MLIQTLRNWWTRKPSSEEVDCLHPAGRFRDLLQCERMRADRSGTSFALVSFVLPEKPRAEEIERLAVRLRSRLRATDHAGFVNERQVGVILWNTHALGATKFADAVAARDEGTPLRYRLYLYPNPPVAPEDDLQDGQTFDLESPAGQSPQQPQPLELLFVKPLPVWKRALDMAGSATALAVLSPLLLATAAAIKLTSPGPVLFKQRRDGLGGRPFTIYKFRTMCLDAEQKKQQLRQFSEQDGPAFKMTHDPRITPIGRYLRKTCIDELPQFWNVLKGDMSLVGPRPLPCDESRQCKGWERRRLEVTPGLTCIWQVFGKSRVPFIEWMRMDIRYMQARTFLQDLRLVWHTAVAVVMHKASQ